jgi:two-component system response regulator AtoC
VRELENYLERIVVFADGPVVTPDDLTGIDALALGSSPVAGSAPSAETPHATPDAAGAPAPERLDERLRDAERAALETALQRCVNNRTQAARLLGISRRTLYNKLAEHGLS